MCTWGSSAGCLAKLLSFFDTSINVVSLHQRQERTLTPCECVFVAIVNYMRCGPLRCAKQRVGVFWSKSSDIDGMNCCCWWNLWNFCEYLLTYILHICMHCGNLYVLSHLLVAQDFLQSFLSKNVTIMRKSRTYITIL